MFVCSFQDDLQCIFWILIKILSTGKFICPLVFTPMFNYKCITVSDQKKKSILFLLTFLTKKPKNLRESRLSNFFLYFYLFYLFPRSGIWGIQVVSPRWPVRPGSFRPRKVSRFAPLNCYYIIIDEVFFDNFLIIIYLLASCCGFTYCYRFSDIAISSVNLFIHMTIGIFKEWLVKYFFVHKIVFKAVLVFLLSVKWRHLFSCEVKTRPIYGMETNI